MPSMTTKIPTTVITGFLGSGKTSIIRHMIEHNCGKKLAFLINEFGELGIDRDMLLGCGMQECTEDDIVELSNGCICCTVADDFLPTMEALLDRPTPPDHILIETSGLALPKPLIKAFDWPSVKSRATVDGVITVVDAKALSEGRFADDEQRIQRQRQADDSLDHDNPLHEVFNDQLVCADMVVLNKADLLTDTALDTVKCQLKPQLRDGVLCIPSHNACVDGAVLLGLQSQSETTIDTIATHHDTPHEHSHEQFLSFTIDLGDIADTERLQSTLIQVVKHHDILRIKGFIYSPQKPMRQVLQGVGTRLHTYFDRLWQDTDIKSTRLVIIGLHTINPDTIRQDIQQGMA